MEASDQIQAIELGKLSAKTTPTTKEGKTCLDLKQSGRGGWATFPFIIGAFGSLSLAAGGWASNLIVFLITQMNVKSIKATQISNVVLGCYSLFPIAGAILSDSFFGPFFVITVFSVVSLLGVILLTLIMTIHSLRPSPCTIAPLICENPSIPQYAVLYAALALVSLGLGGTRFTIATYGAEQFDQASDQGIFFNWFFLILYISNAISFTAIIYIEDNVSWALGFGICVVANAIGLLVFLLGKRYYRHIKPEGSPFMSIGRVMVAAIRMRKMSGAFGGPYNYGSTSTRNMHKAPTKSFRFLNCAALKTDDQDSQSDGSYSRSRRLCTVEEVEDLKVLMKIIPLWFSGVFAGTPFAMFSNLVVLQALSMDRHIGPHFKIPAGTFIVFNILSTAISIVVIDRLFIPAWQNLIRRPLTLLQRVGIGYFITIIGIVGSALLEVRRLHVVQKRHLVDEPGSVVPMSALWLIFPLAIVGFGEGFQFPGQVALYYQEFPVSLKSTSTAMISVQIGIGFYLSTVITDLVRRTTGWLPDNINEGRLDNVFWMLTGIGVVNFGYYLACAKLFKPKIVEEPNVTAEPTI